MKDRYTDKAIKNYSTPATSPPTPSRGSDVMVTRSGTAVSRNARPLAPKSNRVEKSSARKKKDRKTPKKMIEIDRAISEITKDSVIEVCDIEAWVHRPLEVRQAEIEAGKQPGKIKRPMNAFMLYRKAYQNRAKDHWKHHNHQIISQVCGDSWNLESELIRNQFNEWAKIERDNHQRAHPGYKFTPAKPNKPAGRGSREREFGEDDSDLEDFDWNGARNRNRKLMGDPDADYQPPRSMAYGAAPSTYGLMNNLRGQMGLPQHHQSHFDYANPGKPMQMPYDQHTLRGQYYEATTQMHAAHSQLQGGVDELMMRKASIPSMASSSSLNYQQQQQQHQHHPMYYSQMKQYTAQHLLPHQNPHNQNPHNQHHSNPQARHLEQHIDPVLHESAGSGSALFEAGFGNQMFVDGGLSMHQNWHTAPLGAGAVGDQPPYTGAFEGLDETLLQDQQHNQLLSGNANDWQVVAPDSSWDETQP